LQSEFNHRFGYSLGLHLWKEGEYNFRRCFLETSSYPPDLEVRLKEQVAEVVAAFGIQQLEPLLLAQILLDQYEGWELAEIKEICLRARALLNPQGLVSQRLREKLVAQEVLRYLEENQFLNIDGFVRFRIPHYLAGLEEAVEEAVERYSEEKEHGEFVSLLRYFLETQESRVEKVHVVLCPGGGFQLFDSEERYLKDWDGFYIDMSNGDPHYEDLLISTLITLAPKLIIIHGADRSSPHVLETLVQVFGDRLLLCPGCCNCTESMDKG